MCTSSVLQCLTIFDAEFRDRIGDMIFDRIKTNTFELRDFLIREPVANCIDGAPFSRSYLIVVRRTSSWFRHQDILRGAVAIFPPLLRAHCLQPDEDSGTDCLVFATTLYFAKDLRPNLPELRVIPNCVRGKSGAYMIYPGGTI